MKKVKTISKYTLNVLSIISALLIGLAPIWGWDWADNIIQTISVIMAVISTYLLGNKKINSSDFIINIGLCGTTNRNLNIGETFLCNKIIDNDSKKTYFSDILFILLLLKTTV